MSTLKKFRVTFVKLTLIGALFLLLFNVKLNLIPDYLGFVKISPQDYFSLILTTTASFLGIVIAVVLVALELIRNNTGYRPEKESFSYFRLIDFSSVPFALIFFSIVSYIVVPNFSDPKHISIAYFQGYLLIYFMISIYPVIKNMIGNRNLILDSLKDIEKIGLNTANELIWDNNQKYADYPIDHPMLKIKHDLIYFMKVNDISSIIRLLKSLNDKVMEIIGDGRDRKKVNLMLNSMFYVWNGGKGYANTASGFVYFNSIWDCISDLYNHSSKYNINLLHYRDLDFYIDELISSIEKNGNPENLKYGAKTIYQAYVLNLRNNCPTEEEIRLFDENKQKNEKYKTDSKLHWDLLNGLLAKLFKIHERSILNKEVEAFNYSEWQIDDIIEILVKKKIVIGNEQRDSLLIDIFRKLFNNLSIALKTNIDAHGISLYSLFIQSLIKNKDKCTERILLSFGEFIFDNVEYLHSYQINDFAFVGRQNFNEFGIDKEFTNYNKFVVRILELLKAKLEKKKYLGEKYLSYKEVKDSYEYVFKMIPKIEANKAYLDKMSKVLETFSPEPKQRRKNAVKWPE